MSEREIGQILQVGQYLVTLERWCPEYDSWCWGDECVVLKPFRKSRTA